MNNPFIAFLREFALRLKSKNPKFFNILALVMGIVGVVPWIPQALDLIHIYIPEIIEHPTVKRIISACAGIAILWSNLTVDSTAVAVKQDGTVLKETDQKSLPFTSKVEDKKAFKEDLPTVRVMGSVGNNAG